MASITTDAESDIDISDSFTKIGNKIIEIFFNFFINLSIKANATDVSYNCVDSSGNVAASCFESASITDNSSRWFIDGCCCENTTSLQAICCLVELDSSLSKSNQLL